MIDCRQVLASLEDSDGKDHLRFSYIHQRSSSGDTRHTDSGRDDSSRGCCTSLPTDNHKPVCQLLVVVGRAQVTNTPEKHWRQLVPVHTYATSFYFPPCTDSVSPRTVLPHIRKIIGKRDDQTSRKKWHFRHNLRNYAVCVCSEGRRPSANSLSHSSISGQWVAQVPKSAKER